MSINFKRNLYSLLAVIFFGVIAAGSGVSKFHCGAFSHTADGEDKSERRSYVELNDGTKVYGRRVTWSAGLFVRNQIRIDDTKYKIDETRGYFTQGTYYLRHRQDYYERLVAGRLNVYMNTVYVTSPNGTGMGSHTSTRCDYYVQVGDGELKRLIGQKDIKELVSDCPKAYEMIDKTNRQIRRSIRHDPSYLNDIFMTYNDGCR